MNEEVNELESAQQTSQEAPQQPELSLTDLQNIKSVIDVSARRGAFTAAEMEAVGAVYNKLAKFLEAVVPQQEKA